MSLPRSFYLALTAAIGSAAMVVMVHAATPAAVDPDPMKLVGKPAPDFKLDGLEGTSHTLAEAKGNVLLLDFWATWCVPCHVELPHLQELYKAQSSHGLKFFAVNAGDVKAAVAKYVADNKLDVPILLDTDSKMADSFQCGDSLPISVLVGKDGIVKNVFVGFKEGTTSEEIEKAVTAALNDTGKSDTGKSDTGK
jgi:peroxiredoxin